MRVILLIILLCNGGCSIRTVILPKDAAYYYQRWQEELKEGQECEKDLKDLEDVCNDLIPHVP